MTLIFSLLLVLAGAFAYSILRPIDLFSPYRKSSSSSGGFTLQNSSRNSLPELSYVYNLKDASGMTFDPTDGYLYVSDGYMGGITVLNASTNKIVGYITGPTIFGPSVYVPYNGHMYIVGWNGYIYILNPTTEKFISKIGKFTLGYGYALGQPATSLIYDSVNHNVFLKTTYRFSGSLFEINTSSNKVQGVLGDIGVGGGIAFAARYNMLYYSLPNQTIVKIDPDSMSILGFMYYTPAPAVSLEANAILYDPNNNFLYIETSYLSSNASGISLWNRISVWNLVSGQFVWTARLGTGNEYQAALSNAIAYDSISKNVYFASGQHFWAIAGSSGQLSQLVGNISSPNELAIDPVNGTVYGAYDATMFWVGSGSNRVSYYTNSFNEPTGVAYDGNYSAMYVTNRGSNNLTVINSSTNHIVGDMTGVGHSYTIATDPYNGYLIVENFSYYSQQSFVNILNPKNDELLHSFASTFVTADSNTGNLLVLNGSNILTFSWKNWSLLTTAQISGGIYTFTYDPQLNLVTVLTANNSLVLLNPISHSVFKTIGLNLHNGSGLYSNIALNPDGDVAYFCNNQYRWAINLTSGKISWEAPSYGVYSIIYNPHNNLLYLSDGSYNVYLASSATGKILNSVGLGNFVSGLAYDPANGLVYVACSDYAGGESLVALLNYSSPASSFGATNTLLVFSGASATVAAAVFIVWKRYRKR